MLVSIYLYYRPWHLTVREGQPGQTFRIFLTRSFHDIIICHFAGLTKVGNGENF